MSLYPREHVLTSPRIQQESDQVGIQVPSPWQLNKSEAYGKPDGRSKGGKNRNDTARELADRRGAIEKQMLEIGEVLRTERAREEKQARKADKRERKRVHEEKKARREIERQAREEAEQEARRGRKGEAKQVGPEVDTEPNVESTREEEQRPKKRARITGEWPVNYC